MQQRPSSDFYNFPVYHWEASADWTPDASTLARPVWVLLDQATDSELALLHKILAAVPLDVAQECAIITEVGHLHFKDLVASATNLKTLLVFGRSPRDLGLHLRLPPYQLGLFQGTQLLFADGLAAIATNQHAEKQKLWKQVKQLQTP